VIECQIEDGKLLVRTDDAEAEGAKLQLCLAGSEWSAAFAATPMRDGILTFIPAGVDADEVDDPASSAARFMEIVELEPGDRLEHGYDPDGAFDEDDD
jgi:hypothetical protein